MPALLSLLPLLGRLAPELLGLALGGGASAVEARAAGALRDLFGTADPAAVQAALGADPAKEDALRARLDAEAGAMKARLADTADARAATLALASARSPIAWGSPVVSAVVVLAFAAVAVIVFSRFGIDSAVGQLIAGALIAKFGTVVDYWLGSSRAAAERADQLADALHRSLGAAARPAGARP